MDLFAWLQPSGWVQLHFQVEKKHNFWEANGKQDENKG